jgi:protein involved in polysaccharide export with SLBB domain
MRIVGPRSLAILAVLALAAGSAGAEEAPPRPGARPVVPLPDPARPGSSARVVGGSPAVSAVAADYRFVPGDEISIEIVLPPEAEAANPLKEAKRIVVTPGGVVPVPRLRSVRLEGRTSPQVETDVQAILRTAGVAAQADVFVRVVDYAPRYVYLVGAAFARISVTPFGQTNLLHVFAQAGEAMKEVDANVVRVAKTDGRVRVVDVRALLAAGGASPEALLEAGDTVILSERAVKPEPITPVVYILGYVRMPGAYKQIDPQTRAPTTLVQLLALAGGIAEFGNLKAVTIRRHTERIPVSALHILKGQNPDVPLQPGDIVYVDD